MSVLTVVQDAYVRVLSNSTVPATVVNNTNPTVQNFMQALIAEGKDLLLEDPAWSFLIREYTFETVADQEEYQFPSDYQRMLNNTCWDRNQYWQVRGGITPQQWQVIRSGLYQTARLSSNFRIKQSSDLTTKAFYLDPIPSSVRTLVFEMQSNAWLYDPGNPQNNRYNRPQADNNEIMYDDELVTKGLVWRFKKMRNLPFSVDLVEYKDYRNRAIAQDRAPPTLSVAQQPWRLPIGNVPDTGFGAT